MQFLACNLRVSGVNFSRTPSKTGLQNGSVAQLVEQRIENPRVGGSIPSRAIFFVPWLHEILLSTIGA